MSISSRMISEPLPPCTPFIRSLSAALWALPVIIPIGCMVAAPSTRAQIVGLLKSAGPAQAHAAVSKIPTKVLEPKIFTKVATTPYQYTLLDIRAENESRFPFHSGFETATKVAEIERSQGPVAKSSMKAAMPAPAVEQPVLADKPAERMLTITRKSAPARLVENRILREARAIAANALSSEGTIVVLAGIDAPKPGSKCRRLDGAQVDCNERARGRLSVLIMDRRITCKLSAPVREGIRYGQCYADKINIGTDLLRHGLATRATASAVNPVL